VSRSTETTRASPILTDECQARRVQHRWRHSRTFSTAFIDVSRCRCLFTMDGFSDGAWGADCFSVAHREMPK
jgi:hypothetical protein